ncbi:MAG: hypothetical protein IT204_13700 [Fimbriimonadaceae bacterium]|nr:hypothetical protein [Fimbriimonadaceae bacterium]
MKRMLCGLVAWLGVLSGVPAANSVVGEANTLWVVPERNLAWVEPFQARRRPGGGLYTIGGYIAQRDLAWCIAAAMRWLATHSEDAPGFDRAWKQHDLYFSWPDPDQPRGGPSAGLAVAVAAYSALLDKPVRGDVAFTGAVDPQGHVLPVGGIDRKLPAAIVAGMKTCCIPADGAPAPAALALDTARRLRVVLIRNAGEAFFEAFGTEGPEGERYDRMLTLYQAARQAEAERNWSAARLALDNLCELVPNDLSAMRLAAQYSRVDMTVAAANLFADAARYERDGLPDEALRTVRRAWSYADAAQRQKHQELLDRLERSALPADLRVLLDRAREAAASGAVGEAWRLLLEIQRRDPQHPLVGRYLTAWKDFGPVALLEQTVRARPDDTASRQALARALLEAGVPRQAAEQYAVLRRAEPQQPVWATSQARALATAGDLAAAANILREVRPTWPAEVAETGRLLGIELNPPELRLGEWQVQGLLAQRVIQAQDDSPGLRLLLRQAAQQVAELAGSTLLTCDLGRLPSGLHRWDLELRDRYDNVVTAACELPVPPREERPCLRPGAPPAGLLPGAVMVAADEALTVLRGTRLQVVGGHWFARAGQLAAVQVGEQRAEQPPYRLEVPTPSAGALTIGVTATLRDGTPLATRTAAVAVVDAPPAWILAPLAGSLLAGSTPLLVGAAGGETVLLLVDGIPWQRAAASGALLLDAARLAPGEHEITAIVERGTERLLSPPVAVRVPVVATAGEGEAPQVFPASGPLLTVAGQPRDGVRALPAAGPLRLMPWPVPWTAAPLPPASSLALRLDTSPLPAPRQVRIALGDRLAFGQLPDRAALGPQPLLAPGPLATAVWAPPVGTWRLDLPGGPAWVTVTPGPELGLAGVPSSLTASGPLRLDVAVAEELRQAQLTLVAGDLALGTWPAPPAALEVDLAKLPRGPQILRLVSALADGTRVVSRPVVVDGR